MLANLPPVTRALLLANVGVFLLELMFQGPLMQWFALYPLGPAFEPWQLLSYAFLHEGLLHIFLNMFALFMFGPPLENYIGSRRFTLFYFVCVLTAGLTQLTVTSLDHSESYTEGTIGASGAIFGLLLAFAMYFPRQRITLLFPPIPMPAWVFVLIYGLVELFNGVTGTEPGVAHFAHLGGMLGAAAMIFFWRVTDRPRLH